MERTFGDLVKGMFPMPRDKLQELMKASDHLTDLQDFKELKYFLKIGKVEITTEVMGTKKLGAQEEYAVIQPTSEDPDPELQDLVDAWNNEIFSNVKKKMFNNFSKMAEEKIRKLIAPNIIGLENVKEAALLQLFAKDKVHLLLLGDPGTGKTDILRSVAELSPISSYGLGSGTSGAGLTVSMKGDEVMKGLLPLAHKGICCIDELNLMKERDRAGLLNAMEKGFVTYDKAAKHLQVSADVKVLATANPKGDQFAGWTVGTLKKQLPFDPALISRFHMVFLIRKPDIEGFIEITKKIISGEKKVVGEKESEFVKEYIKEVNKINIEFDKKLEPMITNFVEEIKAEEKKFLVEISPRLVIGIIRMAKASARMEMRTVVTQDDVIKVLKLLKESLYLKRRANA